MFLKIKIKSCCNKFFLDYFLLHFDLNILFKIGTSKIEIEFNIFIGHT